MKKYGIAEYLTREQKVRMVRAEYTSVGGRGQPITAEGMCPFGVVGEATNGSELPKRDGSLGYHVNPSAPTAEEIARAIVQQHDMYYEWVESDEVDQVEAAVEALVFEFTEDWDNGKIPPAELPYALGLIELVR